MMKLIAILLSLWADKKFSDIVDLRQLSLYNFLARVVIGLQFGAQTGWISYVLLTVVPAWIMSMVVSALGLFAPLTVMLWAAVLYFCLPGEPVGERLRAYLAAGKSAIQEDIDRHAESLLLQKPPDSDSERDRKVMNALFTENHLHIVCLFFWFFLLGIGGALFYKFNWQLSTIRSGKIKDNPVLQTQIRQALGLLGWIPARFMVLAYGLAGKFNPAFRLLLGKSRLSTGDLLDKNHHLLENAGFSALGYDDSTICDEEHLEATWSMIKKANLILLIGLSIVAVYNWL